MCVGEICLENSGESPEVKIKKRLNSMDGRGRRVGRVKTLAKRIYIQQSGAWISNILQCTDGQIITFLMGPPKHTPGSVAVDPWERKNQGLSGNSLKTTVGAYDDL